MLDYLITMPLYESHDLLEHGGISSYYKGSLHEKHQHIFSELSKFILNSLYNNYDMSNMWANTCPPGSYVKPHNHYNPDFPNALVGVYYIKKPIDSGNLMIEDEEIYVDEDDILFFEDTKMHWTQPNNSNENRIIISFNLNLNNRKY